jgi:hypothetical protein
MAALGYSTITLTLDTYARVMGTNLPDAGAGG